MTGRELAALRVARRAEWEVRVPGMRIVTSVVKYDYVCVCGAECETEREYGPADERDT